MLRTRETLETGAEPADGTVGVIFFLAQGPLPSKRVGNHSRNPINSDPETPLAKPKISVKAPPITAPKKPIRTTPQYAPSSVITVGTSGPITAAVGSKVYCHRDDPRGEGGGVSNLRRRDVHLLYAAAGDVSTTTTQGLYERGAGRQLVWSLPRCFSEARVVAGNT